MKARNYIGRCNMLISGTGLLVVLLWVLLSASGYAAGAEALPPSAVDVRAAEGVNDLQAGVKGAPIGLRGTSVVGRAGALDAWLDPAVFTELSPVSVGEIPVKLPTDQRERDES